ncbi:unnamed protein product [Ceutorhynchus assimilis]|uniref:2-aminoethanethiol dioxygenase n=1 Tax=Ceutorhynchus assimilis TaxID=467358 RepID=A0A9N9MND8_9CUCU|nr:unnamed protein product [Ceutorhynchus assimilis]
MSSHIANVLKQARVTFAKTQKPYKQKIEILSSLLDKTTMNHVNLPKTYMDHHLWEYPEKAPVSCIEIFEDSDVTMGIFMLKPNGKLPLHNHPNMYGLIKVLSGKVKITSFSMNTEKTKEIDQRSFHGESMPYKPSNKILTAELNGVTIANSESPPCIVEPNFRNIHEIQSLDGTAAFLDILAPPYDFERRKCSYYQKLSQASRNIFRLQEIECPSWYWTDSCPYTGPKMYEVQFYV